MPMSARPSIHTPGRTLIFLKTGGGVHIDARAAVPHHPAAVPRPRHRERLAMGCWTWRTGRRSVGCTGRKG